GCIGSHTHMIFLVVATWYCIYRCRSAQLFVFTYDTGSGVLRNHETGMQAGIFYQEGRQSPAATDELVSSSFADACDLTHSNTQEVERDGQRLSVEISTAEDHVFIRKNIWVIGNGIYFAQEN